MSKPQHIPSEMRDGKPQRLREKIQQAIFDHEPSNPKRCTWDPKQLVALLKETEEVLEKLS